MRTQDDDGSTMSLFVCVCVCVCVFVRCHCGDENLPAACREKRLAQVTSLVSGWMDAFLDRVMQCGDSFGKRTVVLSSIGQNVTTKSMMWWVGQRVKSQDGACACACVCVSQTHMTMMTCPMGGSSEKRILSNARSVLKETLRSVRVSPPAAATEPC